MTNAWGAAKAQRILTVTLVLPVTACLHRK
jgi:hypothetical protein